jgi:hypothetical protein
MIFTITREGGQLAAQLTGQPAEPHPNGVPNQIRTLIPAQIPNGAAGV